MRLSTNKSFLNFSIQKKLLKFIVKLDRADSELSFFKALFQLHQLKVALKILFERSQYMEKIQESILYPMIIIPVLLMFIKRFTYFLT